MQKISHDLDSIYEFNDSVAHSYYNESKYSTFYQPSISKEDSLKADKRVKAGEVNIDTIFARQSLESKQDIVRGAISSINSQQMMISMKGDYSYSLNRQVRTHQIEAIGKITLSLACIIFFFIGAPLGAIIRKGGLGVPVIISVLVFIVYYIFENSGMKMARDGNWTVLFGKLISTAVLAPLAIFFTFKANSDSTVFNIDMYKNILFKMLGIRSKRHVYKKEVIINDPDYIKDAEELMRICRDIKQYSHEHSLLKAPNPIKVFFRPGDDQVIEGINERLEAVIEDLSNTKDKTILNELNALPIIATHAHTRPFVRKWMNVVTGVILPFGVFFYLRMWRFRLRLLRDLRNIVAASENIIRRVEEGKKVTISIE